MNRFARLLFIFALLSTKLNAQNVTINIEVLQSFASKAKLYLYSDGQPMLVDSSWQRLPGTYQFTLDSTYQKGLYKVEVGSSISFDIVVNNEPVIDIKTVVFAPLDSLKSSNSTENKVFWKYLKLKESIDQQTWLINSLLNFYSDTSAIKRMLEKEINRLSTNLYTFACEMNATYKNLLANNLIALEQRPIPNLSLSAEEKVKYQIETWWSKVDLTCPHVFNAPAFSGSVWGFVETLYNEEFDKEQQDSAFIAGIEKFISVKMDTTVFKKIRAMLIDGFLESDYLDVVCFLETTSFQGIKPLKTSNNEVFCKSNSLEIGSKASNFNVVNQKGKKVRISNLNADYILVIFWSTWCPHCIESLPRIVDLYNKYKQFGFEVIAISIDEEDELWQQYINKFNAGWINMREPYSPESELIEMFDVQETPKMYLLSKDLTIVSKPSTRRQLEVKIRKLFRNK
ncbi:MAG TPA: TlpA disulfide reductase family protein [Tenuifilaceae bacterium]|nr:TlpA disulfide reductase family protein [Tenuifilaceae bacterium]HPE18988.1 TlpA disulfide reductase family protein [Tenuifilaceae bacterium]HPJ44627.1 TlpA disulfide reductase family protein [Tenuifilaceae bacterium]HPQ33971.1 TlpA disulfide reductase family protein [Tenuifilaceae bacterium]HRX69291.1 TlpA disulfide reductase family protein [Tenuifilaceae bacterium]